MRSLFIMLLILLSWPANTAVNGTLIGWYAPSYYDNGDLIPFDKLMSVYIWQSGTLEPMFVRLAYPNEYFEWDSQTWDSCYDATAVDLTRGVSIRYTQSDIATQQCTPKEPQVGYVCGACHE